jgi:hypothetical protein
LIVATTSAILAEMRQATHSRLAALAALAAALLPFCLAGHAEDPPLGSRQGLPPLYGRLGLSEAQIKKVRELRSGYRAKLLPLHEAIGRLKDQERSALEKVLTAEQFRLLKDYRSGNRK